ncbi:MAG: RepB family plasmid replication initiator protein [Verrucomicrobia bacterium]|jgi:plasmid replication initiation protein|nr:RepB family plasmid replication initiator protein [Verrucomicrobiota bacterium]
MKKSTPPTVLTSKTPKSYKNKKLNNANFGNFNLNDYQVFLHLVSKIGGVNELGKYLQPEQLKREYVLSAKEFSEVFNTDIRTCYRILKKAVDKLMKTDIKVERIELKEVWRINICSMAKYNKGDGYISVKFTDDIMPYLAQVKKKFVLYNLKEISNFGSLYTTRLYELIQEFKETGWVVKSVDQLREAFAVGNKFKAYRDFKIKTFAHACKEINDNYDMDLRFEEEKEGRKVVAVKFFFKKTLVHKVTNQKTGISKNVYQKPKLLAKNKKGKVKQINSDILEGQLSFDDLKTNDDAKPMNSVITSLLAKIFPHKK